MKVVGDIPILHSNVQAMSSGLMVPGAALLEEFLVLERLQQSANTGGYSV